VLVVDVIVGIISIHPGKKRCRVGQATSVTLLALGSALLDENAVEAVAVVGVEGAVEVPPLPPPLVPVAPGILNRLT
jgi:hypothetical protein